jgi:hypothetical protein
MRLTNGTTLPAGWTMGFERDGREMLIVVVKATYALPRQGEEVQLAAQQVPLVEADQFTGEPGFTAPLFETDYAHRKPACDVLLVGRAYAPAGQRVTRTTVGLKVAGMVKAFAVVGERVWRKQMLGVGMSDPQPFESLPISYDCAYGGTDRTDEAHGRTDTFLPNPVGRGYWKHADRIDGLPLPCTEQIDRAVDSPGAAYVPMAFSPIGRHWSPRCAYAGTYDEQWKRSMAPLWPTDFDYRYFQAAPPDQIIPYPVGGEEVVMRNLTPDGHRAFRLPALRMPVTVCPYNGSDVTLEPGVDTIVIEPDHERFTLTWRANLPLRRSMFDVKEVIVGEMSAQWHRERRFPGKPYYRSLAEVVAARGRKES